MATAKKAAKKPAAKKAAKPAKAAASNKPVKGVMSKSDLARHLSVPAATRRQASAALSGLLTALSERRLGTAELPIWAPPARGAGGGMD